MKNEAKKNVQKIITPILPQGDHANKCQESPQGDSTRRLPPLTCAAAKNTLAATNRIAAGVSTLKKSTAKNGSATAHASVIWKSEFTGFTWLISDAPPRLTGLPPEIVSRINNKGMKTT